MTPFVLLSLAIGAFAGAWMTQPLWRPRLPDGGLLPTPDGALTRPDHRTLALPAALTLLILGVAGGGWTWLGSSEGLRVAPAASPIAAAPKPLVGAPPLRAAAPPVAGTRLAEMTERLAERLDRDPGDADGWHMLGRSYAALGKHAQAVGAFRTAAGLRPEDATLLTEWAFSAAVIDQRAGEDAPARLVERALRLAPQDPKALALAGTLALDRRDYAAAVDYWEQLARVEPAESPMGKKIQASIAQVRQLAATRSESMPPDTRNIDTAALAGTGSAVAGTVALAPALLERVAPDDIVFIYARSASGPRMPLAVLRKQVKDLPLRFTLDDSMAMSPANRLTGATRVIVGARIARSGSAIAQDGDLQGQSASIAVGSRDLKIEINEIVKAR